MLVKIGSRMVFVLHRYIFRELAKVFVLATVALTFILSLAGILGPIQEYGVGPAQVIHLLGYSVPITLTFVMPMSALFAAAMVYGRFSSDNELDACRASGVSLPTLVYPGLILAIIVAIVNLILSFHVVPELFHKAEQALKADANKILFRNIQRRGFYELPKREYRIYADQVDPESGTLAGVIVTRTKGGRVEDIITTETARINFTLDKRFNQVQILANEVYRMEGSDQTWFYAQKVPINAEFPSLLGDDIKFKKVQEMKSIRNNPLLFYPVEQAARNAAAQYISELLAEDINDTLSESQDTFYEIAGEPNLIRFSADNVTANIDKMSEQKEVILTGDVVVVEFDFGTGKRKQAWLSSKALLKIEGEEFYPTLTLELTSPRWQKEDGSEGIAAGRKYIRGLLLPENIASKIDSENMLSTLSPSGISAGLKNGPSEKLQRLQLILTIFIQKVLVNIGAEVNIRLVFGVSCIPLILIGIGLGVLYKGGHPLVAFGVSCIPALPLVLFILMGKRVAKHDVSQLGTGIALMWAGCALCLSVTFILYRKLLKN